ncbi:MAG: 4-alpha-glucanotransferase [Microcystaceae cyanobacterium]
MFDKRRSGILLHPTSLPSRFGIGDLGHEAYEFVNFLADSYQTIWQILPIGPTGYGNSPYLCYSAIAGNPFLISPDKLQESGLLSSEDLENIPEFPPFWVDFPNVIPTKMKLLEKAFDNFQKTSDKKLIKAFDSFCSSHSYWLDDYALYMSLKEANEGKAWYQWDEELAQRDPKILQYCTKKLGDSVVFQKFLQFIFFRQWTALKTYANEKGVLIFGDIPIYVAHDSVDVWANPEIFCLDKETGEAELMAGVPPDYFSETGQLWGNPVYNWEKLEKTNFSWWIQRVEGVLELMDITRIDHFRGFESFWAVPQGEETAMNGEWVEASGAAFFTLLQKKLGILPIVAEDLGVITPEVEALRDKFAFPGMKILQFAFDSDRANPFLPYNFVQRNCVVYTGTHDNDTTVGWMNQRSQEEKDRVTDYFGCTCPEGIQWNLIRLALGSVANMAIFPLQDILGYGSDCRMNTPGVAEGNWGWRYSQETLTYELQERLQTLTQMYGRRVYPDPPASETDHEL